ncbi:MAG TPA: LCP family protein [Kineosporiaceae bacterium]|jgi:LCP family protein required for cell wall assembly|nr:LCP family protein [Kineosporiaceae bacterium]
MRHGVARHAPLAVAPPPEAGTGSAGLVLLWTVLGSVVPGLGYVRAGRRRLGWAVLGGTVVVAVAVAAWVLVVGPVRLAESIGVSPVKLVWLAVVLAGIAVLWGVLVVTTHAAVRGSAPFTVLPSVACLVVVVLLVGAGAVPALAAANSALIARQTLLAVFGGGRGTDLARVQQPVVGSEVPPSGPKTAPDPWANVPRVNVLLIGADTGADRWGTRPDTLVVASIDTHSGETVLFSLPRNLQRVPFPPKSPAAAAYPNGFWCLDPATGANTDCLLNGFWTFAESHAGDYYAGVRNPGLTATIQAAEAVTGLQIGRYLLVDLAGFKEFVNAIGGLEVTVRERLPIGGSVENPGGTTGWIEPGRQKLDGYRALWYARSRWSTDDFDRMRRQRCVIGALTQQADPETLAANFPAIAKAARQSIRTDVALDELDAWVELARRVQSAHVRSLPFTDDVIDTVNPDFAKVHALVKRALQPPAPAGSSPSPSAGPSAAPSPAPSVAKPAPSAAPSAAGTKAADVRSVC